MRKMRTAEEMVAYCRETGITTRWRNSALEKHFKTIEFALNDDEFVVFCFIGIHFINAYVEEAHEYAYALTNKRLLIGKGTSSRKLYVTSYKDINTIDVGKRNVLIDSIKAEESATVGFEEAVNIKRELQTVLPTILKQKVIRERANRFTGSVADEIIKFKQLRDEGVITEAEFQKQKDLLLNPGWEEFVVDFGDEAEESDKKVYHVKRPLQIHKRK